MDIDPEVTLVGNEDNKNDSDDEDETHSDEEGAASEEEGVLRKGKRMKSPHLPLYANMMIHLEDNPEEEQKGRKHLKRRPRLRPFLCLDVNNDDDPDDEEYTDSEGSDESATEDEEPIVLPKKRTHKEKYAPLQKIEYKIAIYTPQQMRKPKNSRGPPITKVIKLESNKRWRILHRHIALGSAPFDFSDYSVTFTVLRHISTQLPAAGHDAHTLPAKPRLVCTRCRVSAGRADTIEGAGRQAAQTAPPWKHAPDAFVIARAWYVRIHELLSTRLHTLAVFVLAHRFVRTHPPRRATPVDMPMPDISVQSRRAMSTAGLRNDLQWVHQVVMCAASRPVSRSESIQACFVPQTAMTRVSLEDKMKKSRSRAGKSKLEEKTQSLRNLRD
ncbi:hypothetical protein K438DRAFT_1778807 [Mycena galopus ATCC 62051]|nr:hypothetical protein K438DRAFT_1778807 [Mycena galopus ATCC 62051]